MSVFVCVYVCACACEGEGVVSVCLRVCRGWHEGAGACVFVCVCMCGVCVCVCVVSDISKGRGPVSTIHVEYTSFSSVKVSKTDLAHFHSLFFV